MSYIEAILDSFYKNTGSHSLDASVLTLMLSCLLLSALS